MVKYTNEQAIARKVIKSYPKIDDNHPSSWVLYNDDFSVVQEWLLRQCHSALAFNGPDNTFDHLITAVPNNSPEALAYLTFLIEGPFSRWRKQIALKSLDDKHYLLISGLDTFPANAMYNFCIASRFPIEYPMVLPIWTKLCDAGVEPALAFMLSLSVAPAWLHSKSDGTPEGADPLKWVVTNMPKVAGHLWVDGSSDWRAILDGEPVEKFLTAPFREQCLGSRPCNLIWGTGDRAFMIKMIDRTVQEVVDMFATDLTIAPIVPSEQPLLPMDELDLEETDYDDTFDDEFFNEFGYDEVDEL